MAERRGGDLNEQLAEIAECPICTDKIKNNRLLPCGHTFCLGCLEKYKRSSKAKGKSLSCPVCRKEFGIPKGGCTMFPKNIIVEKLLEVENQSKDENHVRMCDTCENENQTNAVVHCIECDQSLCGECEKLHGRLKVSAAHHIVPVSKNNSQFKDFARRSYYCEDHPEYTLELMCNDCDKTICWKCRSLSHADHRAADMKDIADGCCEQLQSNIEEIDSRLSVLSKVVENIKDQEKQYEDNFVKEKASVSKTASELIRSVVTNEEKLIRQMESALQKNLNALQPHKKQVQAQMDSLKQHKALVNQLKDSGNSHEILKRTAELHSTADQLFSVSIISINEPILSYLTESEIKKQLIGSNVAATNGFADVRRSSSDYNRFIHNETGNPGTRLPEGMGSSQTKTTQLNLTATSTSQTNTGTNSKGKSLGLPPATLKKPERKPSLSLRTPSPDDTNMNAAAYAASPDAPTPGFYSNLPPVTSPPPQLPPRANLPSTPSATDRNIQSIKSTEQQPYAKGLPVTTNIGSSVSSFTVGAGSAVFGVAVHKQKVYVATENSPDITVYSSNEHSLLHTLVVPGLKQASDLTFCRRNSCLYLIDWLVRSIFRVEIEGVKEITSWGTDGEFGGLSASGDGTVILAGHETNSLKEYTTRGTLNRTVKLKSDISESIRPWHAVKLASEKFIVSHGSSSDTALHRVCLVDSDGQIIKSFGGLRGRGNTSLWGPYHLCMTDENKLFIADCNNGRIVVLDENLEFVGEIAGNLRKPRRICFDKTSNKLFATDNRLLAKKASDGRIVIFSQVL